jgi:hypothetical protein
MTLNPRSGHGGIHPGQNILEQGSSVMEDVRAF